MRMNRLLFLVLCLASACASKPPGTPVVQTPLGVAMDAYLDRLSGFGFSGAVLVTKGDTVLLEKGYGWADVERRVPFTAQTGFFVASVSKQFIAASILKLEDENRLSMSDSLGVFLPHAPDDKRSITVHQLLTQASGLPSHLAGDTLGRTYSKEAFLEEVFAAPLEFPPGTAFAYSNTGYQLLVTIVEVASGRSFSDYLDRHLFRGAGMTKSGLYTDSTKWSPEELSHGYAGSLDQGDATLSHHRPYSWTMFGGVISTLEDLRRWDRALRTGTVLSEEASRKFFTPFHEGYAYGWFVGQTSRGTEYAAHDGHVQPEGFNCMYVRYFDEDATVVVLANRGDFSYAEEISGVLARYLFGGPLTMPPDVSAADRDALEPFVGAYALESGGWIRIAWDADGLTLEPVGQDAVNLYCGMDGVPGTTFAAANDGTRRVLAALSRGTSATLDQLLPTTSAARWKADLMETWTSYAAMWGPPRGYRVLHSSPRHERLATTMVRLDFDDVSTVVYYDWEDGKLAGLTDLAAFSAMAKSRPMVPGALPLRPQTPRTFATFDPIGFRTARWRFASNESGEIVALEHLAGSARTIAKRVPGHPAQPGPGADRRISP